MLPLIDHILLWHFSIRSNFSIRILCVFTVPEAWDNHGHEEDMDSSQKSNRPVSASLYRPPSSMPLRFVEFLSALLVKVQYIEYSYLSFIFQVVFL